MTLISSPSRYSGTAPKKRTGVTYTPEPLARFVARSLVGVFPHGPKSRQLHLLDPAVGDGALLLALVRELRLRGHHQLCVHGFDTDGDALRIAQNRIREDSDDRSITISFQQRDFLEFVVSDAAQQGQLFSRAPFAADIVIANPPYVRTQILGAEKANALSAAFGLSGRVDLYHAFILGITALLKSGGLLGVITSNRFMTTRAGAAVRRCFVDNYQLKKIWDLGDTKLFDEAVLPAVVLAARSPDGTGTLPVPFERIHSISGAASAGTAKNILELLSGRTSGDLCTRMGEFELVAGQLAYGPRSDGVWRLSSAEHDNWLSQVEANTYCTFGDISKIRVGVKTTADSVFIRRDWDAIEKKQQPESALLLPLVTHKETRRWRLLAGADAPRILYTHRTMNGKRAPIDIAEFPRASVYLEQHRNRLEGRAYVIAAGRQWFEIWVPHDPSAWARPKLVFRDITEAGEFLIDTEGHVVNGDCYWMEAKNEDQEELLWLAMAVGNSSFALDFYDHKFHNKLYAGRRRFMTQYVEQFPLPHPHSANGRKLVDLAKKLYFAVDSKPELVAELEAEVDQTVHSAFGLEKSPR